MGEQGSEGIGGGITSTKGLLKQSYGPLLLQKLPKVYT